jgi:hypothetical protein
MMPLKNTFIPKASKISHPLPSSHLNVKMPSTLKIKDCTVPLVDIHTRESKMKEEYELLKRNYNETSSTILKLESQILHLQSSHDTLFLLIDELLPLTSLLKTTEIANIKDSLCSIPLRNEDTREIITRTIVMGKNQNSLSLSLTPSHSPSLPPSLPKK